MNATTTPTMPSVCPVCSDWGFVSPPERVAAVAALRTHLATGAPVAAYAGPWADDYAVVPCDCAKDDAAEVRASKERINAAFAALGWGRAFDLTISKDGAR